jgi:hypothetical protein
MLSCAIGAKEGWDVATADINGAFMQTDMEDTVHMMLKGKMAELLKTLLEIPNGKKQKADQSCVCN